MGQINHLGLSFSECKKQEDTAKQDKQMYQCIPQRDHILLPDEILDGAV